MEEKNERSQKIIDKIKSIKNLSPSNREIFLKKRISDENNDKISYNNYHNNNNISKMPLSPFNGNKKSTSTEKESFKEKAKNKSKEKEKYGAINKSKNLTPLIHKYKKKNLYDHNNYEAIRNFDETNDKKNKLYENQREPSFLKKFIAKIKDNGTGEGKISVDKNGGKSTDINNYSFRQNSNQKERDEDENFALNQQKNNSFNNKKLNNTAENEENKKEMKNKDNSQNINYDNNSIIIDNKINIFLNEFPQQNSEKDNIYKKGSRKYINHKQRNKNKNRSVEFRKKGAHLPNINIISNINSSGHNPKSYISTEENNNYNTSKMKTEENDYYSNDVKKEIILSNKHKLPKLSLVSKQIKQNNNNSMTERSQKNSNNNDILLCILCEKKCKKPLMCPKCHKVCCHECLQKKKKKNKFCSFCNKYLRDISEYIEIKNINNKRNIKNKKVKDIKEDSLNKKLGHYSNKKSLKEKIPSFGEKNISEKKKSKIQISINPNKNEIEENTKMNDNSAHNVRNNKCLSDKMKKEKIKQNESIDINEFNTNNKYPEPIENKKENKKIIFDNINQEQNKEANEEEVKENKEYENNDKNEEKTVDNINEIEIIKENNCSIHNKKIKYYCFQCDKDYCEECMINHANTHNLIDYCYINYNKFKELLSEKNEINNRNNVLQNYINDFEQKIKNYTLEKDIFISEINKIANNYINNLESQINEINDSLKKIKEEQNKLIEKNNLLNDYFNITYKLNIEKIKDNNISEEFPSNIKKIELDNIDYSNQISKIIKDKNCFQFNYLTSDIIKDIPISNNNNLILFSKLNFDINNINNFLNDLKNKNNEDINNEINSDNESIELKNIIFDNKNLTNSIFSIKNWNNKALIHANICLNKNLENDKYYFINNISCFLLISNNEINNYCQLEKKMISNGNLCLYDMIDWEKFNIFNYSNLCFKLILFNHNK